MKAFKLGAKVKLNDLEAVSVGLRKVLLTPGVKRRLARARRAVEVVLERGEKVYGVTTGFGELANVQISRDKIRRLNLNYIRSHSAGVGEPLGEDETRAMIFLRANELESVEALAQERSTEVESRRHEALRQVDLAGVM